jgi:hypothetical protein
MGAFGGFVGPYLIGRVNERTGEFTPGLLLLAGLWWRRSSSSWVCERGR